MNKQKLSKIEEDIQKGRIEDWDAVRIVPQVTITVYGRTGNKHYTTMCDYATGEVLSETILNEKNPIHKNGIRMYKLNVKSINASKNS